MEVFEWTVQNECHLLEAMMGHKPIGINKWFQMLLIYDKFVQKVDKEFRSDVIWRHLETLYNIEALDEIETIPFPNNETDFELPDHEFAILKELKLEEKKGTQKNRETPKIQKELTKKDDKLIFRNSKDGQRKDSKDNKSFTSLKREFKKDTEKPVKIIKNRRLSNTSKDEIAKTKNKAEETPKTTKRPTRASIKPDETNSGKASPVMTTSAMQPKRRRI